MKLLVEETAVRVKDAGWMCMEMPFEHWPFLAKPQEVADLLLRLANDQ